MVENSFYSQKSSNFAPLFAKSLVSLYPQPSYINPQVCHGCATGTGQWHHSFCISPRPTPVNLSSCLYDAPLSFNSFNTILFDLSSST